MLTVKESNHEIRSRDLLLSLMCYAFMCLQSKPEVPICRMDVVGRVDRRFDSSTIFRLLYIMLVFFLAF